MYLGFWLMGNGIQGEAADKFGEALKLASDQRPKQGFFETFTTMFTREHPAGLDTSSLAGTMELWKEFWLFPAGLAAVVFVLFALLFWDRTRTIEVSSPEE